jgi:hypothetical protein
LALQSSFWPSPCLIFWFPNIFRHMVGLHGRVISPSQGLYLHRTTQHRKTRTNINASSGIRTCDPVYERSRPARPLDRRSNVVRVILFRRMSQEWHRCEYSLWAKLGRHVGKIKGRGSVGSRSKDCRIILKWILEKQCVMVGTGSNWLRSDLTFCTHFSSPPRVLHVLSISSFLISSPFSQMLPNTNYEAPHCVIISISRYFQILYPELLIKLCSFHLTHFYMVNI